MKISRTIIICALYSVLCTPLFAAANSGMDTVSSEWFREWYQYGLALQTEQWMTYYEYSLSHPDESQLEIANHFGRGHSTIQRALQFMSTPHR